MSRDLDADLRFAHSLADAADAVTLGRVSGARPSGRDEARPDAGVRGGQGGGGDNPRADPRVGPRRRGPRRGVRRRRRATCAGSSTRSTGRSRTFAACPSGRRCWRSKSRARSRSPSSRPRRWPALVGDARRRRIRRRRAAVGLARSRRSRPQRSPRRRSATCRRAGRSSLDRAWAVRGWADFWQHCLVAEGAIELAVENGLKIWDYAAISLVVEEAGGRMTTFDGEPLRPDGTVLARTACSTTRRERSLGL